MRSKIRVFICVEIIASGCVNETLLTIARVLDRSKFDHKIICIWKGGAFPEAFKAEGVEQLLLALLHILLSGKSIKRNLTI